MDAGDAPDPSEQHVAPRWRLREARPEDAGDIERLVRELAAYEREPDAVVATAADYAAALFGEHPLVHCLIAEVEAGGPHREAAGPDGEAGGFDVGAAGADVDVKIAGIAVWFATFSTWRGRHGVWLEDLFVSPEYRGLGLGRALLSRLAAIAVERGYERVEWSVLDWNAPALGFYRRLGAEALDDWTVHRLTGEALRTLAVSSGYVAVSNRISAKGDALPRAKGGVA